MRTTLADFQPFTRSLFSVKGRWLWNPLRLTSDDLHAIEVGVAANLASAVVIGLAIVAARNLSVWALAFQIPLGLVYCVMSVFVGDFDEKGRSTRSRLRRGFARFLLYFGYVFALYGLLALVGKAAGLG